MQYCKLNVFQHCLLGGHSQLAVTSEERLIAGSSLKSSSQNAVAAKKANKLLPLSGRVQRAELCKTLMCWVLCVLCVLCVLLIYASQERVVGLKKVYKRATK